MTQRKRDFTFRQLNSFVAVAREGSFALAAEKLNISQPAVSDHIAALEQHLGHSLFLRRRGTTPTLTREGFDMLYRAESLLQTSKSMRSDTLTERNSKVSIRVSVSPRLRDVYLRPLIPTLYAAHPHLEIELVPALPIREASAALKRGDIDLLFSTVGHLPDALPNVRQVDDIPILFVAAPQMAAKMTRGALAIEDLPFILPHNPRISEHWFERTLAAMGIMPRKPIRYMEYADVVQTLVEDGVGASILMHEQVSAALLANRLTTFGPALPPMKRILVRAPNAPLDAELLESAIVRALRTALRQE